MILPLLAETIGSDTSITIGLLLGVFGLVGGSIVAAIVSRVNHGNAISQLRRDIDAEKGQRISDTLDHERRLRGLEEWKIREDALDDAVKASKSTASGTRPYPR